MIARIFGAVLLWFSLTSQGYTQSIDAILKIENREIFGGQITLNRIARDNLSAWPLTIDAVWIGCRSDLKVFTVIMFTGQDAWALNGATRGHARHGNYKLTLDGNEYVVQTDHDEWWWAYEDSEEELKRWRELNPDSNPKKNIQPLFDFSQSLGCLD